MPSWKRQKWLRKVSSRSGSATNEGTTSMSSSSGSASSAGAMRLGSSTQSGSATRAGAMTQASSSRSGLSIDGSSFGGGMRSTSKGMTGQSGCSSASGDSAISSESATRSGISSAHVAGNPATLVDVVAPVESEWDALSSSSVGKVDGCCCSCPCYSFCSKGSFRMGRHHGSEGRKSIKIAPKTPYVTSETHRK